MMHSDNEVILIEDKEPTSSFADKDLGNKTFPMQESEKMEEDEDSDQPKIFLRNIAEMEEQQSDDNKNVTAAIPKHNCCEGKSMKNLINWEKGYGNPSKLPAAQNDGKLDEYGYKLTAKVGQFQNPIPSTISVSLSSMASPIPPLPTNTNPGYAVRCAVNERVPSSQLQPPSQIVAANSATAPIGVTLVPTSKAFAASAPPKPLTTGSQKSEFAQSKTCPSLVVKPQPFLTTPANRVKLFKIQSQLNQLVKSILAKTSTEFVEFLIQRGLLRNSQHCQNHPRNICQLGMFYKVSPNSPNTSKCPYSGGYTWISSCCPNTTHSVFHNSLFQNTPYPPGTLLNLMYHWICQTPVASILQWVHVTDNFLKAFYTNIRSLCRVYLDEFMSPMGGDGKLVEVGIIKLKNAAVTSHGRSATMEILGCFDRATKLLRMKIVNCLFHQISSEGENPTLESGRRAFMVMVTLSNWIDRKSTILTDNVINHSIFLEVGFQNILLCSNVEQGVLTNCNVMKYLKTAIPKMLRGTSCVLSKNLVQQFLDELTWREKFGTQRLVAYHNLIHQVGIVTKWELPQGQTLTGWLDNVAQEPWIDCSYSKRESRSPHKIIPFGLRNEPGIKECLQHTTKNVPGRKCSNAVVSAATKSSPVMQQTTQLRANVTVSPPRAAQEIYDESAGVDVVSTSKSNQEQFKNCYRDRYSTEEKDFCLQQVYYGTWRANQRQTLEREMKSFPKMVKCPLCFRKFQAPFDIVRHLWDHVSKLGILHGFRDICRICLSSLPTSVTMELHIRRKHMIGSLDLACRICEVYFNSKGDLVRHMAYFHQAREAPYNCSICDFCTSFHIEMIYHFDKMHGMEAKLLCPLCLQVYNCAKSTQLSSLLTHLQSHWQYLQKCKRCCLSFSSERNLAAHMHQHKRRDDSTGRWVAYQLGNPQEQELQAVMMGSPLANLHPLNVAIFERQWEHVFQTSSPTSAKQPRRRPESLNVPESLSIQMNEVSGGSWNPIQVKERDQNHFEELGEDIAKPKHFVGRLFCTQTNCGFQTACRKSMDIHLEINHSPGGKIKSSLKTKPVKQLPEIMYCNSGHPTKSAKHLIECEKYAVYQKIPEIEMQEIGSLDEIDDVAIAAGIENRNLGDQ